MKFSFIPGRHRFKCVQCGKCCYPAALSLTEADHRAISQEHVATAMVENPDPPFTHALMCKGKCPFLTEDTLCRIWEKRPAVCASFPLTFTYTPEGEMFVNYIACEGQDAEGGEPVDEAFVRKTLGEVEKRNPDFFEVHRKQRMSAHQLLFPFYTVRELTDYESKQAFKERLAAMLLSIPADPHNFRVSCQTFLRLVSEALDSKLAGLPRGRTKTILFRDDIERISTGTEKDLNAKWVSVLHEFRTIVDVNERVAIKTGTCNILWEGEARQASLEDALETSDLTATTRTFKASSIFFRRDFSRDAFRILLEHLAEVLTRVDLGGFPMDAEVGVMLQTMRDYVNNIETYCYMYGGKSPEISGDIARQVVRDLDTFFVLGGSYASKVGTVLNTPM